MDEMSSGQVLRFGILTAAHLHAWSYVSAMRERDDATVVGIWDDNVERGEDFAQKAGIPFVGYLDELLATVDVVAVTCENNRHVELCEVAAKAGKHIICEKPLVARPEDADKMTAAINAAGVKLMTAFPCRFSPAYQRMKERIAAGEIGRIKAIAATNRGRCPFGWFVEPELSGGGSMIDHVVHVTDLLRDLLGEEPATVQAQIGNNVYGEKWEDTAMVTLQFPSGIFATLDSSWSRPQNFKTWGDVTMTVVGEKGVIELDMFGPGIDFYHPGSTTHTVAGYGTNLDWLMVDAFVKACLNGTDVPVTMHDGLQAAKVAMAGYRSVKEG